LSEVAAAPKEARFQLGRIAFLPRPFRYIYYTLIICGVGIYLYYTFGPLKIAGRFLLLEQYNYFYLLFATFGSSVFFVLPARRADAKRLPWYDLVLAMVMLGSCLYFFFHAREILEVGWTPPRTATGLILAIGFCIICLESGRRMGGLAFLIICIIALIYPLLAGYLPGILKGVQFRFDYVVGIFAYGRQGALGMPAQVLGDVIIGFLIFCAILLATGAGEFFINLAMSLFGRFRGGPAKVAVSSSCLFGMVTGNPLAAVLTIGGITVPAMKKCGYSSEYAGGILSCASMGTMIMPPVMGTIAFIMAVLINVSYTEIVIASILPAVLYYYSLSLQVDGYAGRFNLKGMARRELPSAIAALKTGWPFLIVLAFLVFGLLYMRWSGGEVGIYSALLCIILSFINRSTRITRNTIGPTIGTIGNMIVQTVSVLLPSAFIIAGLQMTGTLGNLVAQIVALSGANSFLILAVAAVVCFVFGMVGISLIAYLILAATMAPALAQAAGLDIIGLHLFIAYFSLTGGITPPVAIISFVAAAFVGANPMKTAWTATRLGIVLYFIPFFFVYEKSLLMHGQPLSSLYYFALCLVGIGFLSSGIEGYLWKVGQINWWVRVLLIIGGFLIAMPTGWQTLSIGCGMAIAAMAALLIRKMLAKRT
jgi:TRAP transporter 4TM/12TM fusion protein